MGTRREAREAQAEDHLSAVTTSQRSELTERLEALETHATAAVDAFAAQQRAMEGLEARIRQLEHAHQIWSVMAYVRDVAVEENSLVSVILATRNRSGSVTRAIRSVLSQNYPRWELLAVDDGSDDDTYEVLGGVSDTRIRRFQISHRGLPGARNHALAQASGDYVAYIDDDNTMHPDWLRSVVWAFENWPATDVLYGATMVDRPADGASRTRDRMPWLRFVPYSREALLRENLTDIGAVAHRAGLPDGIFDERLGALEDWDLLLRFSRDRDLLALPVITGTYRTTASDRLTGSATWDRALDLLRTKHPLGVTSA